jgi:uncharacterized protein
VLIAGLLALALVIPPAPAMRMNDYAGVLTAAERDRLETQLTEREAVTGAQMVIAIFKSLEGESLEDYSIRLAQQWRVGQKSLDNGVILLVFVDDRKVRMEVGYGLEPVIPDAVAGRIIRDVIGPRFREQRYAAGLAAAVQAVFERVDTKADPGKRAPQQRDQGFSPLWMFLIFIVIGVLLLREMRGPDRRAARNAYTARGRGWYAPAAVFPWFGSGRGGGGGFFGGGGGGGGGGFSGGGGSFGGGGASGDW